MLFGFWTFFLNPRRLLHAAIVIKPSTLLRFHRELKELKYLLLYSSHPKRKPGPKGPAPVLIQAICGLKRRNPRFGRPKIVLHLAKTFGLEIGFLKRETYRDIPNSAVANLLPSAKFPDSPDTVDRLPLS